jgi:transcriptional regulator of arginine metabolism
MQIQDMRLDDAILHHLSRQEIVDQASLLTLLRADGFDLTVSTLSRRMSRLQVRKDRGVYRQMAPERMPVAPTSIRKVPPCLLILKTSPGTAQALAVALDNKALPSLAGSIAGYDSIFIAAIDPSHLDSLEEEVRRCLANGF